MRTRNIIKLCAILVVVTTISTVLYLPASAKESQDASDRYYMGTLVNTGKDNGYSGEKKITKKDLHFKWELGQFYVDGYSRVDGKHTDKPVIIKNTGDEVTLWFSLKQDINKLNGKKNLVINSDKNGYDEVFDIPKSDFGKGTLIVQHTDYQNKKGEPVIYRDYLAANVSKDADTKVQLCEEGDYEVSLLYEVKDNGILFFDSYENYRISFQFSVRNGNTMVFPFDVVTKQELTNESYTENGFYLDLANSHYLNVDIKKEVLQGGATELTEDTRFNRPAKDKEEFTEEGIYTITVKNPTTGEETVKRIYVGTDSVMKAHVVTGLSITEINAKVQNGASIDDDGTIIQAEPIPDDESDDNNIIKIAVPVAVGIVVLGGVILVVRNKTKTNKEKVDEENTEE